ncbi:MAG: hypothetical protein CMI96_05910 [Pelagibacteraceae bacterium]|nr:hypothetical protein [Pelagibacteraceae bacterium]|tara:strand:- start:115 stop:489 length:375 start_codon:yes stop_codon:yes gene_type:complete
MVSLGWVYFKGEGTPVNINEAFKWTKLGVENGAVEAIPNIALHYANGWGTQKDLVRALMWAQIGMKLDPPDSGNPRRTSRIKRNAIKLERFYEKFAKGMSTGEIKQAEMKATKCEAQNYQSFAC